MKNRMFRLCALLPLLFLAGATASTLASDCQNPVILWLATDVMISPEGDVCVLLAADPGRYQLTIDRPAQVRVTHDPCYEVGESPIVAEGDVPDGAPWEFVVDAPGMLWVIIDVKEAALLSLIYAPSTAEAPPVPPQ